MNKQVCLESLFEGKGFNVIEQDDYKIDINYGQKDWGMVAALRELFSNMIDTKAEYHYELKDGVGTISDKGTGLPRKAFIMGASSKSNDNTSIGQFGEGLKMALITSLRNGRKVSIQTVGYGAEITAVHAKEYDTNIMRILFTDNVSEAGTVIKIECTEEEWNQALDLFLQFKEGYRQLDKNLYLPGGYISILGLKTEEKPNMLFSYDLNDKSLTNRDRNTVKSKKLKESMGNILNSLKNQKAIKMYLLGIADNTDADEYKIALQPKHKEVWMTVINKLYGDKVVYSTTIENDIKATAKGYKVIRCTSKATQQTFKALGLESSREASKGMKNNEVSIIEKDSITYPISKNYVENWSYVDAGREILSNAIDSATSPKEATIQYKDGQCIIKDNGLGIAKQNFVIGNSQKSDSDIGMFGEGLKLAALVMAREERNMTIETVGYTYTPMIEESEEFKTEIFSIKFKKNARTKGTIIRFDATEEEVNMISELFILYKENLVSVTQGDTQIILNEKGNIYVNGLKSASFDTLFSYNFNDKALVNTRDRNHINETRFIESLTKVFNETTDANVLDEFLLGWQTNPYLYEYKLMIRPVNLSAWEERIKQLYGNSCISTFNMESNFIAKRAGYKVLSEIPAYVKDILAYFLPTSSEIAEQYKDKGILVNNRILYPITEDYCSEWNVTDAISELLSNALDTDTEVRAECIANTIYIEDKGPGFKKQNLLLGSSGSRSVGTAIGTFGEGMKMAALVLSKQLLNFQIETVGFTVKAFLEEDTDFDAKLLVFELSENTREEGTVVSFKGSERSLTEAKNRFLAFNKKYTPVGESKEIYKPGGYIFINGVATQRIDSCYSYNLTGSDAKFVLNRDRKSIDLNDARSVVTNILGDTSEDEVIKTLLTLDDSSMYESVFASYTFKINGKKKKRWKRIMADCYENCCLPVVNSEINLVAKDKGFNVLMNLSGVVSSLLMYLDFPKANQVVKLRGDEEYVRNIVKEEDFTEEEASKLKVVRNAIRLTMGDSYVDKLDICESFVRDPYEGKTLGLYVPQVNRCYVLRELLSDEYSLAELLGTVRHEFAHMTSGTHDRTREFENELTDIIGDLLERLYA